MDIRRIGPLVTLLGLAACTNHLEVAKVAPGATSVAERSGFPYNLQFTQYKIVLTRRVVDCSNEFKSNVSAEITSESVADGDYAYVIRTDSLISPMKISDMKIEWDKGKLKLINASAEDRTAQTVLAVVQGLGKIAATGILGGGVGANGAVEGCSDKVVEALRGRKKAEDDVSAITAELEGLTTEITRLSAQLIAAGANAALQGALKTELDKQDGAKLRLAEAQKRLATTTKFLTHQETVRWPERSNIFQTEKPYLPPLSIFEQWYDVPARDGETAADHKIRRDAEYSKLAQKMGVFLRIERVGSFGWDPTSPIKPGEADNGDERDGVRFRVPATGRLVVCEAVLCSFDAGTNVVTSSTGQVLQLGQIYYASFSSPPFTNGGFEMAFDENGVPTKAGIGRKSASAETAVGLFKDLSGEGASIYNALSVTAEEKAAKKLTALETAKKIADAEAALDPSSPAKQLAALQIQKQIAEVSAALAPAPGADLLRLATIAEAQNRLNDALAKAAADPNADYKALQETYRAQELMYRSQAAMIEADLIAQAARARVGN